VSRRNPSHSRGRSPLHGLRWVTSVHFHAHNPAKLPRGAARLTGEVVPPKGQGALQNNPSSGSQQLGGPTAFEPDSGRGHVLALRATGVATRLPTMRSGWQCNQTAGSETLNLETVLVLRGRFPLDSSNWLAAFRKIARQEGSPAEESTWWQPLANLPESGASSEKFTKLGSTAQILDASSIFHGNLHPGTAHALSRYAAVGFVQRRKPPALGGDVRPPASRRSSILDAPSSLRGGGHAPGSDLRTAFRRPRWPSSWRRRAFVFS
jgi:hypothetical protein